MSNRIRLRRSDGRVYLDRWGIEHPKLGGVFVHRMTAPDPGKDFHDHPWIFWSLILWGGYTEYRAETRRPTRRIVSAPRKSWSLRSMRLDECHRIVCLNGPVSWSLVIHGPNRRPWGFYTPDGWVGSHAYFTTPRGQQRGLRDEAA